ncbi:hypothetical protein ACWC2T_40935 [Streptomyces sp. NPDC001393]
MPRVKQAHPDPVPAVEVSLGSVLKDAPADTPRRTPRRWFMVWLTGERGV